VADTSDEIIAVNRVLVRRAGKHSLRATGAADAELEHTAASCRVVEIQNRFIGRDGQVGVIKPVSGSARHTAKDGASARQNV
jgi:hypothetical protein